MSVRIALNVEMLVGHLRYANEIWDSLPKTKLDALQRLQDRARTIIENARLKDNWSCDWLSI